QVQAVQRTIKCSLARSINAISVVNMSGAIQTDTYMNIVMLYEITPGLIDQCAVGLKAMRNMDTTCIELFCYLKGPLIKRARQHKRFACMPDDRDMIGEKG